MNTSTIERERPSEFDPFSASFRADTDAYYPELLQRSPGFMVLEGIPSAYVIKHAQVMQVLTDFKRFSSVKPPGLPGMERVDFFNGKPVMNYSDPPQHDRLRRIVNASFLPGRVRELSSGIERIIDDLLRSIAAHSEIEAVSALCKPMAIQLVLGHFMQIPRGDEHIFTDYVATLPLLDQVPPGGGKPKAFLEAWEAGVRYCVDAVARARRDNTGGLIGLLAAANQEEGRLSDDELMAMMVVLLTGGFPTISASASASLKHLVREPVVASRIRATPDLAVRHYEESLRCDPPVTLVMRFATEDAEIGGATITQGMPVYVMIAGACRDPEVFAAPEAFNIERDNFRSHLAFGYGLHSCIGANLARACVPALIRAVTERFPKLRLANPDAPFAYDTTPRSRHLGALRLAV